MELLNKKIKLAFKQGFSLIEVLFASLIVSITLAGILSMSVSFENSNDKFEAEGISEMLTHSIISAMRLNPNGWRDGSDSTLNNFSATEQKCIFDETSSCSASELFKDQKYYLKTELFNNFDCNLTNKTFCLDLKKSYINYLGKCAPSLNITKIRINISIKRAVNKSTNSSFDQSTIICI